MEYLRIDPRIDEHPDIVEVGFSGSVVFQAVLRACATFDKRGRMPAKFCGKWLARRMGLDADRSETTEAPEVFVDMGIERCVRVGLLERDGADIVIPGWERFYTPPDLSTDRVKRFRERMKRCETDETDETVETLLTPPTSPTPLTSLTPPPPSPPPSVGEPPAAQKAGGGEESDGLTANDYWDFIQAERQDRAIPKEPKRPRGFDPWFQRQSVAFSQRVMGLAYGRYLRDDDFAPKQWPTAVFITDGVFLSRTGKPAAPPERRL